ncbi:MAG: hypothetical protein AB7W37_05780 [Syntrophobacteraceae bacterium]
MKVRSSISGKSDVGKKGLLDFLGVRSLFPEPKTPCKVDRKAPSTERG